MSPPVSAERRTLVLLTQNFPFGGGETFLADEVPYLAEYFPRARVVPLHILPGAARPMPKGWELDRGLSDIRQTSSISWLPTALSVWASQLRSRGGDSSWWVHGSNLLNGAFKGAFRYRASMNSRAHRMIRRHLRFLRTAAWIDRWFVTSSIRPEDVLVYSYWFEAVAFGVAALKLRHATSLRCVSRAHRWDLYAPEDDPQYFPFREAALDAYNNIFPVSEDGVRYIQKLYPPPGDPEKPISGRSNVHVARLGVAPNRLCPPSTDGVLRLLSCSRLLPQKRVERLVDVLFLFAQKHPSQRLEWHHLGDGLQGPYLRNYAATHLPPSARVVWRGDVPHEEVLRTLRTGPWDVFINVSDSEGVPVSIMEALAAGIPIMATGVGGTTEIVDEQVGVCLDKHWDLGSAVDALWDITRPGQHARFRERARERWAMRCDARRNYREFARQLWSLFCFDHNGSHE